MSVTPGKVTATVLAGAWFIAMLTGAGEMTSGVAKGALALLFPLALIWFPEQLGSFTGCVGRGGNVDTPTPSALISAIGWFILVGVPVVMYLVARSA